MSNLKLNIPITFEAGAALQIKEDITQSVQNSYGMLTTFNQSATGFDMFLSYLDSTDEHYSGLSIDQNKIILDAAYTYIQVPGGGRTEFFSTADGKAKINTNYITADNVTAKSLNTTGGGSTINISAGTIQCTSSSTNSQIVFGIDNNGDAVLKFILNGQVLYNLGPNGLKMLNISTREPSFNNISLKPNSGYSSSIQINPTIGSTLYIPAYRGSISFSTVQDLNNPDNDITFADHFELHMDYINMQTSESGQEQVTEEDLAKYVVYEKLSSLNISNYVLVDFNKNHNIYKEFICGFKKIQQLIWYYNVDDSDDNLIQNIPIYHGKVYNGSTSLTESDITNTSNYISNGYYINTSDSTNPIDSGFPIIDKRNDNGGTYLNFYNNIIHLENEQYISYITYGSNYFAVDTTAIDIRTFNIYNYNNGNAENPATGYIIICYTESNIDGKYIGHYNDFYWTYNINGTGSRRVKFIKETRSSDIYGILCSRTGVIYQPDSSTVTTSNIMEKYLEWLNSIDGVDTNTGSEVDEEPMG